MPAAAFPRSIRTVWLSKVPSTLVKRGLIDEEAAKVGVTGLVSSHDSMVSECIFRGAEHNSGEIVDVMNAKDLW